MTETAITAYSESQIALMRQTVARGCSDSQVGLMLQLAQKYKLDPFARQIWATPAGIIIGRDGFLAFAHNTGDFDGIETTFEEQDGKLISATTTVWHKKMSHPVTFTARFDEFNKPNSESWRKMPRVMLQKCAESNALRRAFCVTGLYDAAELDECSAVEPMQTVDADFTATVDGVEVKVEKVKDAKPVCACGAEPMVEEEWSIYRDAFRNQNLGEIPRHICKKCCTEEWNKRKEAV